MKNVFAVVSVLALAGAASANIMEMQALDFSFPLNPGSQTLTFNQFDTQGGARVLKGVKIEVDATIQVNITAENDSDIPNANFGVSLTGFVDVDGPESFDAAANIAAALGPVSVEANDGVTGSGPDFYDFGLLSGSDNDSTILSPIFTPAALSGNGTFDVQVNGNGGYSATGGTDANLLVSNFGASGRVKVTFFWEVPAPGAVAVFGLAGLAGARRRRA